jgi:hypothetical protein
MRACYPLPPDRAAQQQGGLRPELTGSGHRQNPDRAGRARTRACHGNNKHLYQKIQRCRRGEQRSAHPEAIPGIGRRGRSEKYQSPVCRFHRATVSAITAAIQPESAYLNGVLYMSEHRAGDQLSGVEPSRRSFIAKFAGAVFAAPLISSFALDGMAQASPAHQKHHHGNMPYSGYGNLSYGHMHHSYGNSSGHKHGEGCDDPFWWVYGECFPFDNHHHRKVKWW